MSHATRQISIDSDDDFGVFDERYASKEPSVQQGHREYQMAIEVSRKTCSLDCWTKERVGVWGLAPTIIEGLLVSMGLEDDVDFVEGKQWSR